MVGEALLAARSGASAMHDPTEGGVAAALFELASASGRRLTVDLDRITVHPHTTRLCAHFGLRPLGLIAFRRVAPDDPRARAPALLGAFKRRRIPAAVIGAVTSGRGVTA